MAPQGSLNLEQNSFFGYPPSVHGMPASVNFARNAFILSESSDALQYDLPPSIEYVLNSFVRHLFPNSLDLLISLEIN
jgi:hypothetical protein